MLRAVLAAGLVAGLVAGTACRVSLEDSETGDDSITGRSCTVSTTSKPCMDATTHADLAWIEANVFKTSCIFSGCHNGDSSPQGRVDLRAGMSHAHLVGYASQIDQTRKLVVASDVQASYLMLMLHDYDPATANPPGAAPPGSIGYMPQGTGGVALCCQKLDAIERWIMAGAPSN